MKTKRTVSAVLPLLCWFALVLVGWPAFAQNVYWVHNPATEGEWDDPTNWSTGKVPQYPEDAYVDNGGTAHVDSNHSTDYLNVGYSQNGTIEQDAGTMSVGDTYLGFSQASQGYYLLSGTGELGSYYRDFYVGYYGTGVFIQTGNSDHSPGTVFVGRQVGSHGTYELAGGRLYLNRLHVGYDGEGTFRQTGGLVDLNRGSPNVLLIGEYAPTGIGIYELVGGELRGALTSIGNGGNGHFKHTGGLHYMRGYYLCLGGVDFAGGIGIYELSDHGNLTGVNTMYVGQNNGEGRFIQRGGSSSFGNAYVGRNVGALGFFEVWGGSALVTGQNYTQGTAGTLISKVQSDGLATIDISTSASLAGSWQILDDGAPLERWDVLTAPTGISGAFDSVLLPSLDWSWGIDNNTTLWLEHVPEPATLGLLAAGLGAIWLKRRRKA